MLLGRGRSKSGGTVNRPVHRPKGRGSVAGDDNWPNFRQRVLAAENQKRFARLDPSEEGKEVALEGLAR